MGTIAAVVLGFFCGALPLAVWLGRYGLRRDITQVGDHNPGAFNVLRAGGIAWGGLAIALEIAKGALPVGLAAQVWRFDGIDLVAAAIAPVLGHAWSPFLRFRGGKAIAVSLGIWIGMTLWTVPLAGTTALVVGYRLFTISGWAVMLAAATVGITLAVLRATSAVWIVWLLNVAILVYKHRADLSQPLRLRGSA